MAYRAKRRTTRSRASASRSRSYTARRTRTASSRRRKVSRSGRGQTVRLVIQHVGGVPAAQTSDKSAVTPLRAMF